MLERLEPGKYNISLIKPTSGNERWMVEISQSVTIQKKELYSGEASTEEVR